MTPTNLPRLAGLLHHLPDARDLRIAGPDGTAQALPWQAVEVYAAVPDLVDLAKLQAESNRGMRDAIALIMDDIRAALRLPASTPWVDVLARARSLAQTDPARTLDGEVGDGQ